MKTFKLFFIMLIALNAYSQECTKLGTYIGTFSASFMPYIDAEEPQILRNITWDNHISMLASNSELMESLSNFMDTLENRGIQTVMSVRFPYSDSLNKEDRIIHDAVELDAFMLDLQTVLLELNGKLDYLQVLNENLGNGSYNHTIDSLIYSGLSETQAHEMVLDWMDTITNRFRNTIENNSINVSLLSPSVLPLGIQSVKNNQTNNWSYKVTVKIHDLANQYCDFLNYHWYPTSFAKMQELIHFSDTSSILQINPNIGRSCTEWSQAHEVRDILLNDTEFWSTELNIHCGTSDINLTPDYLSLINESLGVIHSHTYDMYQLMNDRDYEFAAYYAMIQDSYNCGETDLIFYALASLYATRFTANSVPNGLFYHEYQNIKQYIATNCQAVYIDDNIWPENPLIIFPNPAFDFVQIQSNKTDLIYEIYNSFGQFISSGQYHNQIDLSNFISGIYFLKIYDKTNSTILKLIKL